MDSYTVPETFETVRDVADAFDCLDHLPEALQPMFAAQIVRVMESSPGGAAVIGHLVGLYPLEKRKHFYKLLGFEYTIA